MITMPIPPKTATCKLEPRSMESKTHERMQNIKLMELGIDPFEYDIDESYTEDEQEILNEAIRLITLDQNLPEELEQQVKEITQKHK